MPRRRTRHQTVQLQGWAALIPLVLVGGIVLLCLLSVIASQYPWVLILLPIVVVACAGSVGFWWFQRRRHLEQLQAYQQQQLQAAYQQQQWDAYHQHQRISQQQQLLEAQRQQAEAQRVHQRQQLEAQREYQRQQAEAQQELQRQQLEAQRQQAEAQLELQRQQAEAQQRLLEQQRQLSFAQDIGNLLALTPREFELAIGDLLRKLGYQQVRHTGKAGDLAADLHAISPRGEHVIVQCKRYAPGNAVGSGDIQKFIGMRVHHQAQRALFVTTSTFKTPATTLARQHGIELIDGQQLVAMFARVNKNP